MKIQESGDRRIYFPRSVSLVPAGSSVTSGSLDARDYGAAKRVRFEHVRYSFCVESGGYEVTGSRENATLLYGWG